MTNKDKTKILKAGDTFYFIYQIHNNLSHPNYGYPLWSSSSPWYVMPAYAVVWLPIQIPEKRGISTEIHTIYLDTFEHAHRNIDVFPNIEAATAECKRRNAGLEN